MAAFSQAECVDFSLFQDTLKKMRLVDDTIIYALNTKLPTESFRAGKDSQATCRELFTYLENNYKAREEGFTRCLEYSNNRVAELKKRREEEQNNANVLKELRKEQTKVRLLATEIGVEEVIKARTKKVFYERCRHHYLPDNFDDI